MFARWRCRQENDEIRSSLHFTRLKVIKWKMKSTHWTDSATHHCLDWQCLRNEDAVKKMTKSDSHNISPDDQVKDEVYTLDWLSHSSLPWLTMSAKWRCRQENDEIRLSQHFTRWSSERWSPHTGLTQPLIIALTDNVCETPFFVWKIFLKNERKIRGWF